MDSLYLNDGWGSVSLAVRARDPVPATSATGQNMYSRMRTFNLLALPEELVRVVAQWLEPPDLLHLTMTSRELCKRLTTSLLLNAIRDDGGAAVLVHTVERAGRHYSTNEEAGCYRQTVDCADATKEAETLAKLRLLHRYGADFTKRYIRTSRWSGISYGHSLLDLAVDSGSTSVAMCLLDLRVDVEQAGCENTRVLYCVAQQASGRLDPASAIELYSAVAAKTRSTAESATILFHYLRGLRWSNPRSSARFLANMIACGAPVNVADLPEGMTPLHRALLFPHAVEVLLEHGADRNARTASGNTPADLARLLAEREEETGPRYEDARLYRLSMRVMENYGRMFE